MLTDWANRSGFPKLGLSCGPAELDKTTDFVPNKNAESAMRTRRSRRLENSATFQIAPPSTVKVQDVGKKRKVRSLGTTHPTGGDKIPSGHREAENKEKENACPTS